MKTVDFTEYAKRLAYAYVYNHAAFQFSQDGTPHHDLLLYEAIRDIRKFMIKARMKYGIHLDITEDVEDAIRTGITEGWRDYISTITHSFKLYDEKGVRRRLHDGYSLVEIGEATYLLSCGPVSRILVLPESTSGLMLLVTQIDVMNDIIEDAR